MGRLIDLTGQKFGKLMVLKRTGTSKDGQAVWECECECGNRSYVDGKSLRTGNTKTCGCSRSLPRPQRIKHGKCGTRLYRIWGNMLHRCYGTNDIEKYSYYGGRGIRVCDDWRDFSNFMNWANSAGYNDNLTIDRIDVNGNYCPENCQWATVKAQCANRRSNHFVKENGELHTVTDWAKKLGVSHSTIIKRLKKGGSVYGENSMEASN